MSGRPAPQDWSPRAGSQSEKYRQLHRDASIRAMINSDIASSSAGATETDLQERGLAFKGAWPDQQDGSSSDERLIGVGTWITGDGVPEPPYEKSPPELANVAAHNRTRMLKDGTSVRQNASSSQADAPFAPYNLPATNAMTGSHGKASVDSGSTCEGPSMTPYCVHDGARRSKSLHSQCIGAKGNSSKVPKGRLLKSVKSL